MHKSFLQVAPVAVWSAVTLFTSIPAHALLGLTPVSIGASALGYAACKDVAVTPADRNKCLLILLDPPADGVASVSMSLKFDPATFEILPAPLYFGDFSASGAQIPLQLAVVGGVQPLTAAPTFDFSTATLPRAATSAISPWTTFLERPC